MKRKLSKQDREQIVELLRCAADGLSPTSTGAWTDALNAIEPTGTVEFAASHAFGDAEDEFDIPLFESLECEQGRHIYLEAARRVEEGAWP